ncbi:MAG: VCBS repeat-containing protein [Ignavibacterium sp.]|nr:MAG: VCBS repeat-containing protein [Ignavibacterium sp.]
MRSIVFLFTFLLSNNSIFGADSLEVISVLPTPQAISTEPGEIIQVNFNMRVDPLSFNDSTFMVWGRWSGVHKGIIDFNSIGTTAFFILEKNFFYGEMVTVSLSKGIKDETGKNMKHGFTWNYWVKVNKGALDLTKSETIQVREPGEGWIQTYGTYAGDLDADGWSDFLVPNERPNDVRVFMNDGAGSYSDFSIYRINGGGRPSPNEGMDFNLDGHIDVAVGNSVNDKLTIFLGDGTGSFSSIQNYVADDGVRGVAIADVNGNGFMDVITTNRLASNVSILLNNGDGTFASPMIFEGNGAGETGCATTDVNGDGILDLFIVAHGSDELILFLGTGEGGFSFSAKVIVGKDPWMVATGDINLDGVPDVVSANSGASNFSVVLANEDGSLSNPVNYPTGIFPLAIDLGDIDGDGDLEVVTSNFVTADFTLYENDGKGGFINRRNFEADSAGSCTVLHDRDNDGDMDMTGIDEMDDLLILFTNDNFVNVEDEVKSPENFVLHQNYPNPFNPTTKIKFTIPTQKNPLLGGDYRGGLVTLRVFDILGTEIAILVKEVLPDGDYEIEFDARATHPIALTSGIYFYQLKAGESFIDVKKMILMK